MLCAALDTLSHRQCMLKLARTNTGASRLLGEEGGLLSRLQHPNLVQWHDHLSSIQLQSGESASGFAMALVEGVPFNQDEGALEERLGRFLQLLSAVHYLHRCGFLHLDIKPDNVLVARGRVVLIDLGSARQLDSGPGEAGGTLGYAAPEILRGQAPSIASDMYSLGAVFYELLTEQRPFNLAEPSMLRDAILFGELAPVRALRPSIPRPLARVAEALMAVDAEKRPDSIPVIAEMLLEFGAPADQWRPRSGTPLFVGRDTEQHAVLQMLSQPEQIAVVGEPGSGRSALIRSVLRSETADGRLGVDLTLCQEPITALKTLRSAPWAIGRQGMVYVGRREDLGETQRMRIEAALEGLPGSVKAVWCARVAPTGARELRLGGLGPSAVRHICAFMGVYHAEDVRRASRGTGGLPGRLMSRLGAGQVTEVQATQNLHRLLSVLPLGTPQDFVAQLPASLQQQLPLLVEQGAARVEDGKLFVDALSDVSLAEEEDRIRAALAKVSDLDPLWAALVATRLQDWAQARALLEDALAVARVRKAEVTELCEQLVRNEYRPAVLPLARLYLKDGQRERAAQLLAGLTDLSEPELIEQIIALRLLRRYDEVIEICAERIKMRPLPHPRIFNELVECSRLKGDLDEAERLVELHEPMLLQEGPFQVLKHRVRIARNRLDRSETVPNLTEMMEQVWESRHHPEIPRTLLDTSAQIYRSYIRDPERSRQLLMQAIEIVDRDNERRNSAGLRITLANLLFYTLLQGDRAREVAEEGYRIAQELNAKNLKIQLCYPLCLMELEAGRLPLALRWADRFFHEAEGISAPPVLHRVAYVRAQLAYHQGEVASVLSHLETIPLEKQAPNFLAEIHLLKAQVLYRQGRFAEALALTETCDKHDLPLHEAQHRALRGLAMMGLARQELRSARAMIPAELEMSYRVPAGSVLMAAAGEATDLSRNEERGADLERAARLLRGDRAAEAAAVRQWLTGGGSIDLEGIAELTEAIQEPQGFPAALARLVTRSLGAHRVLIMLKIPGMGQQVSYNELTGAEAAGICDEVLRRIKTPSDYWLAEDAFSDPQLRESSHTVRTFELKSLVAVPIAYQEKAIGALYVDDLYRAGRFGMEDVKILRRLARAVGGLVPLISQQTRKLAEPEDVYGLLTTDAQRVGSIRQTLSMLKRERETNLLITGETGTGKSVLARRLARELFGSANLEVVVLRKGDPNMLVTQLMGSRRGDFTGAMNQEGAIQRALKHNRALFLDEVQNLGEEGQQILLPLLEVTDRRFGGLTGASRKLGQPLHIILATNVEIARGRWADHFREDLWYRMSAAHLHLPPIRERGVEAVYRYLSDILLEIGGVPSPEVLFRPAALLQVTGWRWPGNLRQLRTFAFQAAHRWKLTEQPIAKHELPQLGLSDDAPAPSDGLQALAVKDQERVQVERMLGALRRHGWVQKAAADALGMRPANFSKLLKKYGLRDQVKRRKRASRQAETA